MNSTESGWDNETLSKALQSGNDKAFEYVVLYYHKALYAHIYRIVRNHHDAEDLFQQTCLKVYKNRHTLDCSKPLRPWLYMVATNTVYDFLRKKGTHAELLVLDDEEYVDETISGSVSYYSIEDIDLKDALEQLKPSYKTVLLLYYKDGFSYEEIAAIVQSPINTVKTHLRRAKQQLRYYLYG